VTPFDFLSLGILKVNDENSRIFIRHPNPDPDPLVRGIPNPDPDSHQNVMDPQHCIETSVTDCRNYVFLEFASAS
jgi:hypothetical protein